MFIIIVILTGTLAVILTTPAETQVATPFMSMVAIMVFVDIHVRPSVRESIRLLLLSNFPIAVKVMVPIELPMESMEPRMETVAVEGLTATLINFETFG